MSISSERLDAFVTVARCSSFSKAATQLHVTQSALSQRIKHLEEDLGLTLFIRDSGGVQLTEAGQKMLRYCDIKGRLEEELLDDLSISKAGRISGNLRLACFSSIMRSVVIPSLSEFLRKNMGVSFEFLCRTVQELPQTLSRCEADFIIMDYRLEKSGLEAVHLGVEDYVVIESSRRTSPEDVFLDNDSNDVATELFFAKQKKAKVRYRRSYLADCYGIIDGVREGLGRAVMPKHLVDVPGVKIVKGFEPFTREVVLHYYSQPFYPKLHQETINEIRKNAPNLL
ncbi:MAG: LysR family transcriptional regulator [Oligoflexales bacterium]